MKPEKNTILLNIFLQLYQLLNSFDVIPNTNSITCVKIIIYNLKSNLLKYFFNLRLFNEIRLFLITIFLTCYCLFELEIF